MLIHDAIFPQFSENLSSMKPALGAGFLHVSEN